MKNIIAESKTTSLIIQVEEMFKDNFIGRVLVGNSCNPVGTYSTWSTKSFNISNNEPKKDPIVKIGDEIKAIKCTFGITKDRIYTVENIDLHRVYFINDDNEYSDILLNQWFLFFDLLNVKQDPIVKQVTDKINQRSQVGIKKYGTTLAENNTDDFLTHLQEELFDASLYIEKLKEQKDTYFLLLGRYNELKASCERFDVQNAINELEKLGYIVGLKM